MARVSCLLPDDGLVQLASQLAQQYELDFADIKYCPLDNAVQEALRQRANGVDILIACDIQAENIKRAHILPVVAIQMTGMELADLFVRIRDSWGSGQHIGIVVGAESPQFRFNLQKQLTHFGFAISCYSAVTREEHRAAMEQAVRDGVTLFTGSYLTQGLAHEMGYPALLPEFGEESILSAFANAAEVARVVDFEKAHNAELRTWLEYSVNGTIKINVDGTIQLCNAYVEQLLHTTEASLRGRPLADYFPEVTARELDSVLRDGEEQFLRVSVGDEELTLNIIPIRNGTQPPHSALVFLHDSSRIQKLQNVLPRSKSGLQQAEYTFSMLPNTSAAFSAAVERARLQLRFSKLIHIDGAFGTEKRYLAEALHNELRSGTPFYSVYCTANTGGAGGGEYFYGRGLPADLNLDRILLDAAGGTLFLDGISKLSYANQHRIYEVLQRNAYVNPTIQRLGPGLPQLIITADRHPLGELYRDQRIIAALYYLLGSVQVNITPMAQRPEDAEAWWNALLAQGSEQYGRYIRLTQDALQVLRSHVWIGGLHELRAFVRAAFIQSPRRTVDGAFVRRILQQIAVPTPPPAEQAAPVDAQAQRILDALRACGGSRAAAARQLGISTTTLWRQIKARGLRPEDWQ